MKTFDFDFYFDLQRFDNPEPTTVSTADELKTALVKETAGSIKLTADIALTEDITLGANMTIDLGGHKITGNNVLKVPTTKTLTIGDKTVAPTGVTAEVKMNGSTISSITGLSAGSIAYDGKTYTSGIYVNETTAYGIGGATNVLSLDSTCLYKITGLKSGATGLTVSEKTVTIPNGDTALDGKTITLINGTASDYKLGFTPPATTKGWERDGSSATYTEKNIYTLATGDAPKSITYTASKNVVKITGLENPSAITTDILDASLAVTEPTDDASGKITISKPETNALASGFTVSTANYVVELDTTAGTKAPAPAIDADSVEAQVLDATAGSVKVTGTYNEGYWLSNSNTVNYSAKKTAQTLATITGLTGGLSKFNGQKENGQTDVTGIKFANDTLTINKDLLRTTGVAAVITNNNKPDGNANGFKLAIGAGTTNTTEISSDGSAPATKDIWTVNSTGTVATYKNVTPAYYALNSTSTQINYTAQEDTKNGIHGVISGLQAQVPEGATAAILATYDGDKKLGVATTKDGKTTDPTTEVITAEKAGDKYTFTIEKDALPTTTSNITLTSALPGSKLVRGANVNAQTITDNSSKWDYTTGGTATLKATLSTGYTLSNNDTVIKIAEGGDAKTLLTITGLKAIETEKKAEDSITGITVTNPNTATPTVTLTNEVLTNKDVKITSGTDSFTYSLALDTTTEGKKVTTTSDGNVFAEGTNNTKPTKVKVWAVNNGTATYKEVTPAYYAKDASGTIKYFRQSDEVILATITGLNRSTKDGEKIEVSDDGKKLIVKTDDGDLEAVVASDVNNPDATTGTFTISKCALTTSNVKLTNADGNTYSLEIKTGDNVSEPTATAKWWTVSNGTAVLHASTEAGYKLVDAGQGEDKKDLPDVQIRYYAPNSNKTLATITGLNSNVVALTSEGAAVTGADATTGVKLGIAGTPASGEQAEIAAVIAHSTVGNDGKVTDEPTITLTEAMLKKATVTLRDADTVNDSDTFELKFADGVTQEDTTGRTGSKEWKVNGTTATYVSYDKGYYALGTLADNGSQTVTYNADGAQTKLFTVSGLASGKTYKATGSGESAKIVDNSNGTEYLTINANKEISVTNGAVGTTANKGITLTINDNSYSTAKLIAGTTGTAEEAGKFTAVAYADNPVWSMSGTKATLTKKKSANGIEISSDGKTALYRSADIPMLEITGLKSGLDGGKTEATALATEIAKAITYDTENRTVTLNKNALTTTNVTLRSKDGNNYELDLDTTTADKKVPTSATEGTRWVVSNNGATVVAKNGKSDYYDLADNKQSVIYKREVLESTPLFTISGLKTSTTSTNEAVLANLRGEAVDENGDSVAPYITIDTETSTVKVADAALPDANGNKVTLTTSKGYVFAAPNTEAGDTGKVPTPVVYGTVKWTKTNATDNTAKLNAAVTEAGYELSADGKTLTRVAESAELLTINGVRGLTAQNMNAGTEDDDNDATDTDDGYFIVNKNDKTITVKKDALGTLNLSLTGNNYGYKFVLDGEVQTTAPTSKEKFFEVTASGSTSTAYYRNAKPAYYTLDKNGTAVDAAVIYYKATDVTTPFTITGLKSGVTAAEVTEGIDIAEYADENGDYAVTVKDAANLLGTTDVVLKGNAHYKLALETETSASIQPEEARTWVYDKSKGTLTIKTKYLADGYVVKNGKIVKVKGVNDASPTEDTFAVISGLKKNVDTINGVAVADDGKLVYATQVQALFGDGDSTHHVISDEVALTFKDDTLLGTTNITVATDYGLQLGVADGVNSANETENKWFVSGTTATYKEVKPQSYIAFEDGKKITYNAEKVQKTLATVKGIKAGSATNGTWSESTPVDGVTDGSLSKLQFTPAGESTAVDAITVDDNHVITLKSNALTTSNVTLSTTGDYTLELGNGVKEPELSNYTWTQNANATTATIKAKMAAGYTLTNDKLVTYSKANDNETIATISGLKKGAVGDVTSTGDWDAFKTAIETAKKGVAIADIDGGTVISLSDSILNKTKVSISWGKGHSGYTLALADEQVTTAESGIWSFSNGTATYKSGTPAYYTELADGKSITYTAEKGTGDKLVITGLDKTGAIKAGMNQLQEQVIMKSDASGEQVITLNDTDQTVDIKKAALGTGDVKLTVKGGYTAHTKLALDASDEKYKKDDTEGAVLASTEDETPSWRLGTKSTEAVFATNYSAGYKVIDSGKTIHNYTAAADETETVGGKPYAGQTVYATLTGIDFTDKPAGTTDANYLAENISVDDSGVTPTISVMKGLLGTSNVTLKNGTKTYKLELGSDVETETAAEQDVADEWAVQSAGVAVFKAVKPEYYKLNGDSTITYNRATDKKTYVTVSGLNTSAVANIQNIDVSDNVITLTNEVLNGKDVTMKKGADAPTNGYVFELATGVKSPTDTKTWSYESTTGTASLTAKTSEAGYTLSGDATTVKYSAANASSVLVKITGLKKEELGVGSNNDGTFGSVSGVTIDHNERTVTIGNAALNGTNIAISGTGGYKIKLDEYDEYIPMDNSDGLIWQLTGTTTKTATYKKATKEYYANKTGGTGITYTAAKDAAAGTYVTLNGIAAASDKELVVLNNIIGTRNVGDTTNNSFEAGVLIDDDNAKVYLKSNILPTTDKAAVTIGTPNKVTVNGKTTPYTVKLEEGVTAYEKEDNSEYFTYENNAVVMKATFPSGYTLTNDKVTYTAGGDVTLATLTGLDVSAAFADDYLTAEALAAELAKSTSHRLDYLKTALKAARVADADLADGVLSLSKYDETTGVYTVTPAVEANANANPPVEAKDAVTVTLNDNQKKQFATAKTNDENTARVRKYLADGNYITYTEDGNKILVSEEILGTANVTVKGVAVNGETNTYTLGLEEDYQEPEDTNIWTYNNGTAVYKTVKPKFYAVSNNTIKYTAQKDNETLATITGLVGQTTKTYGTDSGGQPYTDTSVVSLTGDQRFILTTTRTTLTDEENGTTTKTEFAPVEFLALNDEKVVTLTPEALSKKNVTITGTAGYTLALDESVKEPEQTKDENGDNAFTWTGTAGAFKADATNEEKAAEMDSKDYLNALSKNGGTTAAMKANFQEGYTLNPKTATTKGNVTTTTQTVTYSAARNNVTLMTLTGIKTAVGAVTGGTAAENTEATNDKIDAYFKKHVSVETEDNGNVVYVGSALLNQSNIGVTGANGFNVYELKLGDDVEESDSSVETVYGWNNLAYQSYKKAYYNDEHKETEEGKPTAAELNAKRQIVYNKQTAAVNLATISGLKAGVTMSTVIDEENDTKVADEVFDEGTNTITLNQEHLGTGTVRITTTAQGSADEELMSRGVFKLALGDVPSAAQDMVEEWVTNGTTATKKDYTKGYYTLGKATTSSTVDDQIKFTADKPATKTYATVSGLKNSDTTVTDVNGVITLGASQLGTTNVTVRNGAQAGDIDYKLAFVKSGSDLVINTPDYSDTTTTTKNDKGEDVTSTVANSTWTNANKVTTFTAKTKQAYFTLSADEKTATYTRENTAVTARFTGDKTALVAAAAKSANNMVKGSKTITFTSAVFGENNQVTINANGGMEFVNASGKTLVGSGAADVIEAQSGTVNGGGGNDTITATGNNVVISGDGGNDVIDLGSAGATFVYTNGHGNDTVKNFTATGDKADTFKLGTAATTITSVTNDNGNLLVKIGGGTVTLEGAGATESFEYTYTKSDGTTATSSTTITAASADLAESADLLFDDNFVTNDTISELVNTSIDTYSVGNLNATRPMNGIAEQNELVFAFADENNNK